MPHNDPGGVYKVLHIRQTYSATRTHASRSSHSVSPFAANRHAALLLFLSFSFNLALFRPSLVPSPHRRPRSLHLPFVPPPFLSSTVALALPFPLSLSLSLAVFVRHDREPSLPVSTGYGRFGVLQRRRSTSITTLFYRKIKTFFVVPGKCSRFSMSGLDFS